MSFPSRERAPPAHANQPTALEQKPRQRRGRGPHRPLGGEGRKHSANVHFARLQGEIPLSPMPPPGGRSAAEPQKGA